MSLRSLLLRGSSVVAWIAALLIAAPPLAGQEPIPADTVPARPDTIVVPVPAPRDTSPAVEAEPDTLRPPPLLPGLPRDDVAGWSGAEWEWDRDDLGRWHGLTVVDLIEQLPGVTVTRGGWFGQPAGISSYGQGGGRLRVFLDGYELDPLSSASFDLQHIAVADLQAVRVRRGLLDTRVDLTTFRLDARRPFSQIEASTGLYGTRYVRGLFSTITGEEGMLTIGIDVTDTSGWIGQQPFSTNGLMGRWSRLIGERSGFEIEYRQNRLQRSAASAFPLDSQRRDLVLRGRHQAAERLVLDANLGRSWRTAPEADTLGTELSSLQGQVQARYDLGAGWLGAGVRLRDEDDRYSAPRSELHLDGSYRVGPIARASGAVRRLTVDGVPGTEAEARIDFGPIAGFRLFGSAATGSRGIGIVRDTVFVIVEPGEGEEPDTTRLNRFVFPTVSSEAGGFRAGAEWQGGGVQIGGAILRQQRGVVAPFGVAFDRRAAPVDAQPITGFEGFASIPLLPRGLRVEGSHTRWSDVGFRPYLPEQSTRAALVFSRLFYEGNLEPTLRIETYRRGSAIVPGPAHTAFDAVSEPYTWTNLFLQIRVLDVRAFIIFENALDDRLAADIPGRIRGGPRNYYGVRWHFLD